MPEGGSAWQRADQLRAEAAAARVRAEALEREAGAWQAGADGERRVAGELAKLPSTWRVLHDRLLRPDRSLANIDHLVVGPSGVYLIDAKNWAGGVSVHDGTLWQHNGNIHCKRAALEQVHRFAAEVERTVALPVTPVLALPGKASARFIPQRIGGVEVLPLGRLHRWLNEQGHANFVRDVDGLARMLEIAFPPASGPDRSMTATPGSSGRSTSTRPSATKTRTASRAGRGSTSLGRAVFQIVILLFGALFMTQVVVPHMIQKAAKTVASSTPSRQAHRVCDSIPVTLIQKHVKNASIKPGSNGSQTCRWLIRPSGESRTFSLSLTFGQAAHLEVKVIGQGQPKASASNGYAVARVPEGGRLPGWSKTATKANQPIAVLLSYPLPKSGKAPEVQKANTAAMKSIVAFSEEVAPIVAGTEGVETES